MTSPSDWELKEKKKVVMGHAKIKQGEKVLFMSLQTTPGSGELNSEARTQYSWRNKGRAMSLFNLHQTDSSQLCVDCFLASAF